MKLIYMECTIAYLQANDHVTLIEILSSNSFVEKSIKNVRYLICEL